jgi:molybdenum cofactor cytidylyltransferase
VPPRQVGRPREPPAPVAASAAPGKTTTTTITAVGRISPPPSPPSAIVLAAGTASRFNGTKQLAKIDGKTLVERVVDAVPPEGVRETVVVLGHRAPEIAASAGLIGREGVRVVVNSDYRRGLGTSIRKGISSLSDEPDGVLLLLADQPFVSRRLLRQMLALFEEGSGAGRIVAASYGDIVGPPAIFPRRYFGELLGLKGDEGARSIIKNHMGSLVRFELKTGRSLDDIDTREELAAARGSEPQRRREAR